ncbi:MAG: AMP-binding protein [Streptosporangiales bacterium]|nr:AMP-binding protein [Streptosporangiales bacterium]
MSNWIYEFENQVHHRGRAVAIVHDGRSFTYDELNRSASSFAHWLREIGAGRVATYLTNCYEFYVVQFGTVKAGAVSVATNYMFGEETLRYVLQDSSADVLVVAEKDLAEAKSAAAGTNVRYLVTLDGPGNDQVTSLRQVLTDYPEHIVSMPKDDGDLFNVTYTSGTTGTPKGVMKTHRNIGAHVSNLVHAWKLTPESRWLCAGPVYHTSGLESSSLPVLAAGGSVISLRWKPDAFFEHVDRYRPDAAYIAGAMIVDIADYEHPERYDLSSLRFVIAGGAPMPARAYQKILDRYEFTVCERLGMTEAGIIFVDRVGRPGSYEPRDELPGHRIGSCGSPLYNQTQFRLVDPVTNDVRSVGEGELQVRGDSVFAGYLNMPERTKQSFTDDGWFISGDIVRIEDDHVWHLGRRDEIIISGGENVSPRSVEKVVESHPAVVEAVAFPLPHERWGQEVCVAVVLQPDATVTADELLDFCKTGGGLAKYEVPKQVFITDDLPRTPTQSVPRAKLTQRYATATKEPA